MQLAAAYGRPGSTREVELEGEAYFSVVHDATAPFAVRAHGAVAKDVGTAFDVRAYPEDAGARIAVAEGVVAVTRAERGARKGETTPVPRPLSTFVPLLSRAVQLRAGDVATVGQGGVTVEHEVDVASLTAWTAGRLVFHEAPIRLAMAEVARWYNLDIAGVDSTVADIRITAIYDQKPVDAVLTAVTAAVSRHYERHGRAVHISEGQK